MPIMAELSGGSGDGRRASTDNPTPVRREEPPVLPSTTRDESAEGWGERGQAEADSDDERFLRERPPHHEG